MAASRLFVEGSELSHSPLVPAIIALGTRRFQSHGSREVSGASVGARAPAGTSSGDLPRGVSPGESLGLADC